MHSSDDAADFCLPAPLSHVTALPSGCSYNGQQYLDQGTCSNRPCPGSDVSTCSSIENHCCAPVTVTRVTIQCSSFEYDAFIVSACGCSDCLDPYLRLAGILCDCANSQHVRILIFGSLKHSLERCLSYTLPIHRRSCNHQ